jgi:hypothetical protein
MWRPRDDVAQTIIRHFFQHCMELDRKQGAAGCTAASIDHDIVIFILRVVVIVMNNKLALMLLGRLAWWKHMASLRADLRTDLDVWHSCIMRRRGLRLQWDVMVDFILVKEHRARSSSKRVGYTHCQDVCCGNRLSCGLRMQMSTPSANYSSLVIVDTLNSFSSTFNMAHSSELLPSRKEQGN